MKQPDTPCGRCREFTGQLHDENGSAEVMVREGVIVALRDLLPYSSANGDKSVGS